MTAKKLIEVALPLDKINEASAREKSIRHGHPSTLHLWWARRPLAAARAVIWSSLVDDPSSHPELFPTEEDQKKERQRLFDILSDLVVWENSNNEEVLEKAKKEIWKSTKGHLPELLDPFAGGGAIPLEGQRLGLKVHAHDLNPVAVMINKAMIEIPLKFADLPPVNPESRKSLTREGRKGAQGLAEDVQYYGQWMKEEAFKRIGHLYPKVKIPEDQGGGEATVIAWIWARTVKCPNPACGCEMPLASSFVLSKKKGKEDWVEPVFEGGKLSFKVHHDGIPAIKGTVNRKGAICPCCGAPVGFPYIREEGKNHRIGEKLCAIVAEGNPGRLYISADQTQMDVAKVERPLDYPDANLPHNPRDFKTPNYGLTKYSDLFTNRQLDALTVFSELVKEAQKIAEADALKAGLDSSHLGLDDGGTGARAYGQAIGVYLAFTVDKMIDYHSTICIWHSTRELVANAMRRQAVQMTWDFAEANPFSHSSGCFDNMLHWIVQCVSRLPKGTYADVAQMDAQSDCSLRNLMISTDPPYYDNIGYADLSDYFYIWMRQSLRDTYPTLFSTVLVPKTEELIATPYRHHGSTDEAKLFFEEGMLEACQQIYKEASKDIPVTIFYAYKQSNSQDKNNTSTGWETMLSAIIHAGFVITGTWPMKTELVTALKGKVNALASSIVLVCRKRLETAGVTTRRRMIMELRRELRPALKDLQESNIAPVDLAQAAIGPGMAVYSRYREVLEADGTPMTVRSAQALINEEVDSYFNEQVGALDRGSRFCVDLYEQSAYNDVKFGEVEVLANAKGVSIPDLTHMGILYAKAGNVHLVEREKLPDIHKAKNRNVWLLTQQLTYTMQKEGVDGCADILSNLFGSNIEEARNLAYRLYTIADRKNWTEEAYAYNALVVSWPDIQTKAAELRENRPHEMNLFDLDE
jgi:putative DNA methylase